MEGGLPFDMKQPRYNLETEAAMLEARDIANGKTPTEPQRVDSFFKEMGL